MPQILYRTLSSCLLAHFYLMKKYAKVVFQAVFRAHLGDTKPRDRFVEKEVGLRTQNLFAGEIEGFELFLYQANKKLENR
jgi:hypothetical protein